MFNNSVFNAAVIISLVWHLVCMFAVNIVILPGKFKVRELTSVSFLGPILETAALSIILTNKPVAVTMSYHSELKYRYNFDRNGRAHVGDPAKRYIRTHAEDDMHKALRVPFREDKAVPNIVTTGIKRQKDYKLGSSNISGSAGKRSVFYKPEQPKLPTWISASVPFKLELEFSVSPQGEVKRVIPVISSGNPEVDLLGIRYLKSWKFLSLAGGSDEEQWGRITFIFDSEGRMP